MTAPSAPPKPPPPAPPSRSTPPKPSNGAPTSKRTFAVTSGVNATHQRVVVYGPGGVGKTELASNLKGIGFKPLFFDCGSGSHFLDVARIDGLNSWEDLRGAIQDHSLAKDFNAIVVDDLTTAESLGVKWTLANVPHEKGHLVQSIEGYGWGKGFTHVYETFLTLLGDLDAHIRAGRTVVCIAHDCTAKVPNPAGEDWIRYEPRLQNTDKGNIRARVKEWADHLLFLGYDVFSKDGKATGGGSRTIYPAEQATHLAKSRSLASEIVYTKGSCDLWCDLFNLERKGK